jgi:hypothetical protein
VPTERGLVRLASLGDVNGSQWQDLGLDVATDEGSRTATKFYVNGVEPVVTVETSRGYQIQGTPTHRIRVVTEAGDWTWKRFAEINEGDLVPLQMNQLVGEPRHVALPPLPETDFESNVSISTPSVVMEDLAALVGRFARHGRVAANTISIVSHVDHAAETKHLFGSLFNIGADLVPVGTEHVAVMAKSHRLAAWWRLAGFGGLRCEQIPDNILRTNDPAIYRAFLTGVLGEAGRARFSEEAEGLGREVQAMLLAVGAPSDLTQSDEKGHWAWTLSTDCWRISANDQLRGPRFLYDRVSSAELGEEQYTFDLSVPDNVTYVANGFVSHNTIGLLMDCDTTGVEPDFALVKFKKLAGGGYFKIVNQSVTPALRRLGYTETQIEQIVDYVIGTMSLHRAPHINTASLIAKGFTGEDVDKIETLLPGVFELGFAFNQWTLGEATMQRLGFTPEQYNDPRFNMLKALGYTDAEIIEANDYVCGRQTIEGAPGLLDEHLPVFDCANRNGRYGQRFIHHTGHIRMMAAAQPFISGAISKTINMPNEVTIEDIEESYFMSWELGLKAMALYRDGSKASQPLSAKSDDAVSEEEPEELEEALAEEIELVTTGHSTIHGGMFQPGISPAQAYADLPRPRFLLPSRRSGYTQEARIGGHKVFLRTGEYADGTLGELFIDLAKEGATLRGILSCFAIAVSKGLQFGVPLEEFVDTFTFQTFEPRGLVEGHPNIKMANSIVDYVFRALAVEYLNRDDLAQVPPNRNGELPEPASGLAVEAGVQLDLTDAVADQHVSAVASAVKFLDSRPVAPPAPRSAEARKAVVMASKDAGTAAMQSALGEMMGDAPICDVCGHITIRNGSCYKCLNCGNSLGCS